MKTRGFSEYLAAIIADVFLFGFNPKKTRFRVFVVVRSSCGCTHSSWGAKSKPSFLATHQSPTLTHLSVHRVFAFGAPVEGKLQSASVHESQLKLEPMWPPRPKVWLPFWAPPMLARCLAPEQRVVRLATVPRWRRWWMWLTPRRRVTSSFPKPSRRPRQRQRFQWTCKFQRRLLSSASRSATFFCLMRFWPQSVHV